VSDRETELLIDRVFVGAFDGAVKMPNGVAWSPMKSSIDWNEHTDPASRSAVVVLKNGEQVELILRHVQRASSSE
jgi:hypothetical protein